MLLKYVALIKKKKNFIILIPKAFEETSFTLVSRNPSIVIKSIKLTHKNEQVLKF